jgi:hypothetical protein
MLKAQLKPNRISRAWCGGFGVHRSAVPPRSIFTLGNVVTTTGALDFIEESGLSLKRRPLVIQLLWNKSDSSHYETGRGA